MFHRRDRHACTPARETALACLEAGIDAALPERVLETAVALEGDDLRIDGESYDLAAFDRILVLGGGKAAGGLASALVDLLGPRVDDGVVVTTDPDADAVGPVARRAGDHPTPSRRNVAATADLLERADAADEGTLVLAAIAGGASALLCAPADALSLADLRKTTDALLQSGASIGEINAVRKHCSAVKGGLLARRAAPATVVTLAISDVVGDDPAVIASGPTVSDPTTFADALAVLERHDLRDAVPGDVADRLERGADGDGEETPGADDPALAAPNYHRLANGRTAIDAAREVARDRGYEPLVLSSRLTGEAREVGRVHAAVAAEIESDGDPVEPPAVVLSGGEVTVTVDGEGGRGGPNQELSLTAALEFAERGTDAVLATVDTDGIDGPTDAAGAVVDGETVGPDDGERVRRALADHDAYRALAARDALLETGYTGTNVNDLRVVVLG